MITFKEFLLEQTHQETRAKFSELLKSFRAKGIKVWGNETDTEIYISQLVVPKDSRNEGKGSEVMEAIIKHADSVGKTITLSPSNDFGGTKSRLINFYKRFGFVENSGKNKDYSISETMYRLPKA